MKKQILFMLAICAALSSRAQTGPLLIGSASAYGPNNAGSILSHVGGSTGIQQVFGFPANSYNYGPESSTLTQAPDGRLYGLNASDGTEGTLFAYDLLTNTYTVMVNFDSATTGSYPQGSLLLANNGLMYGLTYSGDSTNGGTLFSYAPGSTSVTTLAVLPVSANPISTLIQASDSMLYGLTQYDGIDSNGTIFQYNITSGVYSVLYTFSAGSEPTGFLTEMGRDTLYGMSTYGGINAGGELFQYAVGSGVYTALYDFSADAFPSSGPVVVDGTLYGVTYGDGANAEGTIFSYSLSNGYNDLYDMGNTANDGNFPYGSAMLASDGKIYATTNIGGVYNMGTIFSYNIATSTYTKEADLDTVQGGLFSFGTLTEYLSRPVILTQPASVSTCIGSTEALTAAAGGPAVSAQWQISTDGGASFSDLTGDTTGVLSFVASSADSGNIYRVIFTNYLGADTSAAAVLSVGAPIYDSAVVSGPLCSVSQLAGASYQWIKCSDKAPVVNGNVQNYTAVQNGSYQCVVTSGTCIDTTNCVTVTDAGIAGVAGYSFSLYPDPTTGTFTISNDYPGTASVKVVNLLGASLREFSMSGTQAEFDISSLASGIYEVQISDGARMLTVLKVVKE